MTPLRQRMLEDMQIRNLSDFVRSAGLSIRSVFRQITCGAGPDDIRTYQVYLTNEKKLKPESILVAVSALRFLSTVTLKKDWTFEEVIPACKKPQKLPTILSPAEVLHLLACVRSIKSNSARS